MSFNQQTVDPRDQEAALNLLFFASKPRENAPVVPQPASAVPDSDETSDEEAILLPSNWSPKRLRSHRPTTPSSVPAKRRRTGSPDSDSSMEDAVELSIIATPTQRDALSTGQLGSESATSLPATDATAAQVTATPPGTGGTSKIELSAVAAAAAAAAQQAELVIRRRDTDSTISIAGNDSSLTHDGSIAPSTALEGTAPDQRLESTATTQVSHPAIGSTKQPPHAIPPTHICRCWRGTQPAPELDWARFEIEPAPTVDEPFLCSRCQEHWTHRANGCSMMQGFPWILPSMEKDYVCFHCWESLALDVREAYENHFFDKHAAKFGLVKVPLDVQKYMDMHDKIMGRTRKDTPYGESW